MKCYTVDGSGLDNLQMTERPALAAIPSPEEVVVEVHTVALNYRDLMVADGRYGGREDPPIVAASDMAGVVLKTGSAVKTLKPGDSVLNTPLRSWPAGKLRSEWARTFVGGTGVDGVLAEQVTYPASALVRVPEGLSLAEAATLPVAGLTAWASVVTHGDVQAGDWVLAHGTGGVSIFAMQIAKQCGARTILTTSNPDKGKRATEELGVDAILDYRNPDWPEEVKKLTRGRGADIVVEVAGGASLSSSIRACGYEGMVAVIGVLAGIKSEVNILDLLYHQVSVRGIFMESTEELHALAQALAGAPFRPVIDRTFSFDDARQAYDHLQSQNHFGKVVIALK